MELSGAPPSRANMIDEARKSGPLATGRANRLQVAGVL